MESAQNRWCQKIRPNLNDEVTGDFGNLMRKKRRNCISDPARQLGIAVLTPKEFLNILKSQP